ncbi:MAG: hypothetical protein ACRDGJ_02920 [Candidatus Limnocylindria bacterium]
MASSRRFRGFVETYHDKIRKKLRGAADGEARRDVRAELQVAHLLLADRRIELAFEAYGSGKGGPDFSVTLGQQRFNLEVTRLRGAPSPAAFGGTLLPKLLQLPPSVPNVVVVTIAAAKADARDVDSAVRSLRAQADRKDEAFFTARGFLGTRGFYDRFLRLGAVLAWSEGAVGHARAAAWTNPSARIALPEKALRACVACLRGG